MSCGSTTSGTLYQTNLTANGPVYANSNHVLAAVEPGTTGSLLVSNGPSSPPSFTDPYVTVVGIQGSSVSAFNDLTVVNPTPIIQVDFVFGINSQTGVTTIASTGVADTTASLLRLQTGTNAAGSATFNSNRIARYRQGQGMMARFTGIWQSNAASSTQVIGMGNTQVGYFFGFNGTAFGISSRNGGSDGWIAQANWNGDVCDGTGASGFNWDKSKGNVMMIQYPYLGFGSITFWVMNPTTGAWILCHTIRYPNSSTAVQISNPSFPFYANCTNSGNTSNLIMNVGSVGVFISGVREYLGAQWAYDNVKTISTENCVFNLRNCTTYNGVTNSGISRIRSITAAYQGAGNGYAIVRLKKGVTIGGSPAYTPINGATADNGVTITSGNSIISADTAGTTVTSGTYIFNIAFALNNNATLDLTPYLIFINPTEILTVSAFATNSNSVIIGINWNEDV